MESVTWILLGYFALSRLCTHLPFQSTQNISYCNSAEVKLLKYSKSDQVGVGLKIRATLEERLKQEGIQIAS